MNGRTSSTKEHMRDTIHVPDTISRFGDMIHYSAGGGLDAERQLRAVCR